MADTSLPYHIGAEGVMVRVRVTPNASNDRIEGIQILADGQAVLKVRVRAVPEDGRANKAVLALLAKSLGVPKSAARVARGETARIKHVEVEGRPKDLERKIQALLG